MKPQYMRDRPAIKPWPVDPSRYPLSGPSSGPVYAPRPRARAVWWGLFVLYCIVMVSALAVLKGAQSFTP